MLWPPRNEEGVITGKSVESRVKEVSCLPEQNKICKGPLLLSACLSMQHTEGLSLKLSVPVARNSSSHAPTAGPLAERIKSSPWSPLCTSLGGYHGVGAVYLEKNGPIKASMGKSWYFPAGELIMGFFSAPFLLALWQPSPMQD